MTSVDKCKGGGPSITQSGELLRNLLLPTTDIPLHLPTELALGASVKHLHLACYMAENDH